MTKEKLYEILKSKNELIPDLYDGSYEWMRELVASYAKMDNLELCDIPDLNAIYMMSVGTWRSNVEKKKENLKKTCLPETEKQRLVLVLDKIWEKACHYEYQNEDKSQKPSVGMFGTGFYSFEGKTTKDNAHRFIRMLIDLISLEEDEEMFSQVEEVTAGGFKGMGAAAASMILHCLKPYVFPILNGNMNEKNAYEILGIELDHKSTVETYIENCRRIKKYRDENFSFKNYRVFDAVALFEKDPQDKYEPLLSEYDPNISKETYLDIFTSDGYNKKILDTVYFIYKMGGEASCQQVAEKYGNTYSHYNINANTHMAMGIHKITSCELYQTNDGTVGYWAIPFTIRKTGKNESGAWVQKLREPLYLAIEQLDQEGFFDDMPIYEEKLNMYEKNLILYGPPGTGKTYNTINYAVAICENKRIEDVQSEEYSIVRSRYEKLKKNGRIAFTKFHQSYGYEEFIEGIRPTLSNDDEDSELEYSLEPGVFKKFCEDARFLTKNETEGLGLNRFPTVWKVSLCSTGDNPVRTECLENNHIRIGWDDYGPDITDDTDFKYGGKSILNSFIEKMSIGDIVLSCYSQSTIDAIGVVTGEYEWLPDEYDHYRRSRRVNWLVKDIRENIVERNGGANMTLATVYKMRITVTDVMDILSKYNQTSENKKENYVLIIDEINRGNISKIFGELITLIEPTKRLGAAEEMTVTLPYSKKPFGVPDNVYILGTMNTADRSIAIMDTALRRRFSFIECMPNEDVLNELGADMVYDEGKQLNVALMLKIMNERIEYLYDREHTLGHAFFTELKDTPTLVSLGSIFENKIIPLLQEYFYEDYEKIQLVLGDNSKQDEFKFILDKDTDEADIFNNSSELEELDLPPKRYSINRDAFFKMDSYLGISDKLG